jgi:hypothetical protein
MSLDSVKTHSGILLALGAACRDSGRRDLLLGNPTLGLNGIDFVEFLQPLGGNVLRVHFFFPLPANLYQLGSAKGSFPTIRIEGGSRIVGITAVSVSAVAADPQALDITVSAQGDFSTYWLSVGWVHVPADNSWTYTIPGIDRQFSVAPVNFRPGCPIDFDCAPEVSAGLPALPEPALDYLAKDYASFRQLLLDLVAQRNPTWTETSPADLGIALLELLAYEGDYLSYFQDAVANESFLDTARKRISAKRHARLVDYRMHDGRNAWTWVHFKVSPTGAATSGTMSPGQQLLTRVEAPLRNQPAPPGTVIDASLLNFDTDPALSSVKVFETAATASLDLVNNEIRLHTWGNVQCCFPAGTTLCHLYAVSPDGKTAVLPALKEGDLLLLEEVKSPFTGAPADANPVHRQVVRLTRVDVVTDPLFDTALDASGNLQRKATTPLQVLEAAWAPADALTFELCLSTTLADGSVVGGLCVARGNLALADHGRTVDNETTTFSPPIGPDERYRLTLLRAPITMQCQPAGLQTTVRERTDLTFDVRSVTPAVQLKVLGAAGLSEDWGPPVPDLLQSNEFDTAFVVDVDDDGQGVLRFGDDQYGRSISGTTQITATYRIGNGSAGNVSAEALAHLVGPQPATQPTIVLVRNPLPAQDGTDPETIEEVRQYAPAAFHAVQYRAVTEADYVAAALTIPGVAGAVAQFRWTGSWYTAFLGIDPADPANVVTLSGGRTMLDPLFALTVMEALRKFKLAGYDLEVRSAQYVPLLIEIHLCIRDDHFRADVVKAVLRTLSNGLGPDGRPAFFNPVNLTFGQPVYLSRLYAALDAVSGVDSAEVVVFQRYGRQPQGELQNGVILMGSWEIARLDNDVNLKENGVLIIHADGGK